MRKFKDVRIGCVVTAVGLTGLWMTAGCTTGGPAWWDSPQFKQFKASPEVETVEPAATPAPMETEPSDPQARAAERQVSGELDRLKRAYERARQAKQSQTTAATAVRVDDSDSLAAKLTQPGPVYAPGRDRTATAPPAAKRPVIRPVRQKSTVTITGVEAKGATKSDPVKILNVEPVTAEKAVEPAVPVTVSVAGKTAAGVTTETAGAKPANQAIKLNIPDPVGANASLDKLLRTLEAKLKERPGDTGTQVKLHLVYAMLGQWQEALRDSGGQDRTGGELAKNLAALVKVFDSGTLSPAEQANEALTLLNALQVIFREQADLTVSNMQLCREVVSFGCYKRMPAEYFVAGKRLPVIVYLELENFSSKKIGEESYQTLLSLTMELLDGSGKVSWRKHDDKIEDLANKRRRDFYIARLVTLPAGLPKGGYKLKVTVEDLNGNKVSQKMLPFELR